MIGVVSFLQDTTEVMMPRILTQICRDPTSPLYGCCDRNWWHYKVRDFPSIILQQAGYAVAVAADLPGYLSSAAQLKGLAAATCRFWNARALQYGAFEEYYPYERGYPPLAFSSLAVAKLCSEGVVAVGDVRAGLARAARQLLGRFEDQASNQQVAGTAALAMMRGIAAGLVPEERFQGLLTRTLALQTDEGWFPEYGGPDLGYLSVTLDCLWDLFDATGDERCLAAIYSAFGFLSWFVLGPVGTAGMHNARNTDYIVPYGLARLACGDSNLAGDAMDVLAKLYDARDSGLPHFLYSVDDRYWCHYIGHSVFRALRELNNHQACTKLEEMSQKDRLQESFMNRSKYAILRSPNLEGPSILVSGQKGAVLTAVWPKGQSVSDYGWIIRSRRGEYVTHWWNSSWRTEIGEHEVVCSGSMVLHKEHVSTPWKHMLLRVASFVAGSLLTKILKRLLIFKGDDTHLLFIRKVKAVDTSIVVLDRLEGVSKGDELMRAPRASKRHVASADSFHPEDLDLSFGVTLSERVERQDKAAHITTTYMLREK